MATSRPTSWLPPEAARRQCLRTPGPGRALLFFHACEECGGTVPRDVEFRDAVLPD
ncbi:Uncharacterised protein [Bordetella pertussis]|nr:Uncharacterised protein [Bordetella pertussis]